MVDKRLEYQLGDKGNYLSDNNDYLRWVNLPIVRSVQFRAAMPGAMDYLTSNSTYPTLRGSFACATDSADGDPGYEAADRLIAEAMAQALSANTRRTYRTGWNSWARWAQTRGVPALCAGPVHIQRWLATLVLEGKEPTTLGIYLSAVARELDSCPGPNPARHRDVRLVLSGLRRRAAGDGYTPLQADPLSWAHVMRIADTAHLPRRNQPGGRLETPEQAQRRALCDIAMACVAHDAALRRCELLTIRWADINPPQHRGCWTVRIRRSKTDQTGRGAYAPISEFTARALATIKPACARPEDRVFDISPSTVTRRLKAAAQQAGIDPTNISSHSPRIGMAQHLAAWGIELPGLMLAGRWKTAAMTAHYTQHLAAQNTPAAQYLKTQHPPAHNPKQTGHTPRAA